MSAVVFLVGTHHRPFDRLVAWADAFASAHPQVEVFVQWGNSAAPRVAGGAAFYGRAEVAALLARCDVVVTHGGPSLILETARSGRMPVVVPRDPERGEHIDPHQLEFAGFAEAHGWCRVAASQQALDELVTAFLAGAQPPIGPLPADARHAALAVGELVATLVRGRR